MLASDLTSGVEGTLWIANAAVGGLTAPPIFQLTVGRKSQPKHPGCQFTAPRRHSPPDRRRHGIRDRHQGDRSAGAARIRRQGGDVRGCRRRQDRPADGTDPRHGRALPGHLGVRRHRRALARRPRTVVRHAGVQGARPHRAGVWPDERAARCAVACRLHRADHRRILPRREAPERAAADRQRVPLRAGRQRGLRPA